MNRLECVGKSPKHPHKASAILAEPKHIKPKQSCSTLHAYQVMGQLDILGPEVLDRRRVESPDVRPRKGSTVPVTYSAKEFVPEKMEIPSADEPLPNESISRPWSSRSQLRSARGRSLSPAKSNDPNMSKFPPGRIGEHTVSPIPSSTTLMMDINIKPKHSPETTASNEFIRQKTRLNKQANHATASSLPLWEPDEGTGKSVYARQSWAGPLQNPSPQRRPKSPTSCEPGKEEEDSDDEERKAPLELFAEFLKSVMDEDYALAKKLCQMILIYEPENPEAKQFIPLIEEKLLLEQEEEPSEEDESSDDTEDDSDSSDSDSRGESSEHSDSSSSSKEDEGEESEKKHKDCVPPPASA